MGKDKAKTTRFESAGEAAKELFDGFNVWSGGVSTYGAQTSYAIIAANWAVYGSADKILSNKLAVFSMIIIILFKCDIRWYLNKRDLEEFENVIF